MQQGLGCSLGIMEGQHEVIQGLSDAVALADVLLTATQQQARPGHTRYQASAGSQTSATYSTEGQPDPSVPGSAVDRTRPSLDNPRQLSVNVNQSPLAPPQLDVSPVQSSERPRTSVPRPQLMPVSSGRARPALARHSIAIGTYKLVQSGPQGWTTTASVRASSVASVAHTSGTSSKHITPPGAVTPVIPTSGVRLGIRVLGLAGMSVRGPVAHILCERRTHACLPLSQVPECDEFCAFDVHDPANATLKVKLVGETRSWACRPRTLGKVHINVAAVLRDPVAYSQPRWHILRGAHRRGKSEAKVQLQCVFQPEARCAQRSLEVLCCTWNLGNKPPAEDLSSWLLGVGDLEHDLVAIGVQECAYKVEDGRTGTGDTRGQGRETGGTSPSTPRIPTAGPSSDPSTTSTSPTRTASAACPSQPLQQPRPGSSVHGVLGQPALPKRPSSSPLVQALAEGGADLAARVSAPSWTAKLTFSQQWENQLKAAMGRHYRMVACVHMGQIRLAVFARHDVVMGVSHVTTDSQPTGVGGIANNKGGVAVALQVWGTQMCFVNSHLAAHQGKTPARNANYRDIVKGLRGLYPHGDVLTAPDHVFWLGDLNYRLDFGVQSVNGQDSPTALDFQSLVASIESNQLNDLLQVCQLRKEIEAQAAFLRFQEPPITFPPTFKVDRTPGLQYMDKRSPAWCDRVLYRSNVPGKEAVPRGYFCSSTISTSDHKPVGAVFSVPLIRSLSLANARTSSGPAAVSAGGATPNSAGGVHGLGGMPGAVHDGGNPHMTSMSLAGSGVLDSRLLRAISGRAAAATAGGGSANQPVASALVITGLRASGLPLSRAARALGGRQIASLPSTHGPSTRVALHGPCLVDAHGWVSGVAPRTCSPVWVGGVELSPSSRTLLSDAAGPAAGGQPGGGGSGGGAEEGALLTGRVPSAFAGRCGQPQHVTLPLQPTLLSELATARLLVRVVEAEGGSISSSAGLPAGSTPSYTTSQSTQGSSVTGGGTSNSSSAIYGVLPLAVLLAALQSTQGAPVFGQSASFEVPLERHGLPAGTLYVTAELEPQHPTAGNVLSPSSSLLQRMSSALALRRR